MTHDIDSCDKCDTWQKCDTQDMWDTHDMCHTMTAKSSKMQKKCKNLIIEN
jgi:hypothetical protein